MTVCRFYMQGGCKFGNNCRYEHPRQSSQQQGVLRPSSFSGFGRQQSWGSGGGSDSAFSGVSSRMQARLGPQTQSQGQGQGQSVFGRQGQSAQPPAATQGNNISEILTTISQEMTLWQKNKMWPFSCFGYTKAVPSLPGLDDLSTEEVRLKAYEANNSGNAASYQTWVKDLYNQYSTLQKQLEKPDAALRAKLVSFIEGVIKNSPADGSSGAPQSTGGFGVSPLSAGQGKPFGSTSVFGGSSSSNQTSMFGAPSQQQAGGASPFSAQSQPQGANSSVFGGAQTQSTGASSAFAAQSSGKSIFGAQAQNSGTSPFSSASGASVFGAQSQAQSGGTSVFSGQNQAAQPSAFGTNQSASSSAFGAQNQPTTAGQGVLGGAQNPAAALAGILQLSSGAATQGSTAFGGGATGQQAGQSAFSSVVQPAVPNTQAAFGGTTQPTVPNTQTAFSGPTQTPQQGQAGFGGTTQPVGFGANQQQQPATTAGSGLFGKPSTTATPQAGSSLSTFSFAASNQQSAGQVQQPTGLFGKPASTSAFGGTALSGTTSNDPNPDWCTPLDQLTEDEKAQFMADSFTVGKIPIRPPPIELC